jgi:hypothetical protein
MSNVRLATAKVMSSRREKLMTDEFNPYKPGSGLKDDFDGTIVDGVFTTDPQTGATSVIIMVQCDDGDEWPGRYGCGGGWESYDGGVSVRHPGGPRQLFNAQSAYSDFMQHAWDAGAKDDMLGRIKTVGGPTVAANWNGMRFHWGVEERPVRRPEDREDGSRVWVNATVQRTLPNKYLGLAGVQESLPVSQSDTSAISAQADPLNVLDAVTAAKVKAAARDSNSYEQFIDKMLGLTNSTGTPIMDFVEIGTAVASSDWYTALHRSEIGGA